MFITRKTALLAAVFLVACDLPSGPDEARDQLARGKPRIVPVDLPLPPVTLKLRDQLASPGSGLAGLIDTSDMSLAIQPAPVSIELGRFLTFDALDLQPVHQGFSPVIASYFMLVPIDAEPIAVTLPEDADSSVIVPSSGGTFAFTRDLSASYATATFGGVSTLRLTLATDAASSLDGVSVSLERLSGEIIVGAPAVPVFAGSTRTIDLPLTGRTLPSQFRVRLSFLSSNGTGAGIGLRVRSQFMNAAIVSATGVDAARVVPTRITRNVALSVNNADFTEAELSSGTLSLEAFRLGDLVFTPLSGFESDLTGKRVSATAPDSIRVDGMIAARAGLARVTIATHGDATVMASNLAIRRATLRSVAFDVDQRVTVLDATSDQFRGIEEVVVEHGAITILLANRLRVGGTVTITLDGATAPGGGPVSRVVVIPASPDERPVTVLVTIPLDGATVKPALVSARAVGSIRGTNVSITTAAASDAFAADPDVSAIQAGMVRLSNAPARRFAFSELQTLTAASAGLAGAADLLRGVRLAGVDLTARIRNGAGIAMEIDSLTIALVNARDSSAIRDRAGHPVRITLDRAGTGRLDVGAFASSSTTVEATDFVNELVQRIIAGDAVSFLASGSAGFGSASGTLLPSDHIDVELTARTPFDLAIPDSGIRLDRTHSEIMDLDRGAADFIADLEHSLESGELLLRLTNASPFAVRASLALAPTPADTVGFDPFATDERLVIANIELPAADVDTAGVVITPMTTTQTITIPVEKLALFRHRRLGLSVRATIHAGASGHARLGRDDYLTIVPRARLRVGTIEKSR